MKITKLLFALSCLFGPGLELLHAQPKALPILAPRNQTAVSGALSPDGKKLYIGTGNEKNTGTCELQIWDLTTRKMERAMPVNTFHWMAAIAVSPDGKYVAGGGANAANVYVYDTATGNLIHTLKGHGGAQAIAFHPDSKRLAVGGDDRSIRIWDVATGEQKMRLDGHVSWVGSLSFRDARTLASGSDKEIRFWDVTSGRSRGMLKAHDGVVTALVHSPVANVLFSGSRDKTVRVWDLNAFKELHVFRGHTQEVLGLALSKDGKILFSGAGECSRPDIRSEVKRWDINAKRLDQEWLGPIGRVHLVTMVDMDRYVGIVGGGFDNRGLPVDTDWKIYESSGGREP